MVQTHVLGRQCLKSMRTDYKAQIPSAGKLTAGVLRVGAVRALKVGALRVEALTVEQALACLEQVGVVANRVHAARSQVPAARRSVALSAKNLARNSAAHVNQDVNASTCQLPTIATRRQRTVAAVLGRSHSL